MPAVAGPAHRTHDKRVSKTASTVSPSRTTKHMADFLIAVTVLLTTLPRTAVGFVVAGETNDPCAGLVDMLPGCDTTATFPQDCSNPIVKNNLCRYTCCDQRVISCGSTVNGTTGAVNNASAYAMDQGHSYWFTLDDVTVVQLATCNVAGTEDTNYDTELSL